MRYVFLLILLACPAAALSQVTTVNGASFRANQPVSPGSFVSAFGTFANVGAAGATSLPLPKTLNGVSVTVSGIEAALHYVSSTQINFAIPYQAQPGVRAVVVNGPGGAVQGSVVIVSAAPGIFAANQQGSGLGAILNQDFSANGPQRPAIRGQVIQIFATGHASLASALADGAAGPSNPPIATSGTPQVFIGGVECPVEFSGLAPTFAALWQINCRIPAFSFLSGQLPVQVFMNGVDSNEVTVYVAQ